MFEKSKDEELMQVEQVRQELELALRECREQLAQTKALLRESKTKTEASA